LQCSFKLVVGHRKERAKDGQRKKRKVHYGTIVFNVPLDTSYVVSEMIFPANQLTGAKTSLPKQSLGWY